MPRSRALAAIATGCALAYLALTLAVAGGLTLVVDDAVYDLFRPEGVWGPTQVELARVLGVVRPVVWVGILGLVAASVAVRRRHVAPLAFAVLLTVPAAAVVVVTKWLVVRADPADGFVPHYGAFPSGHVTLALTSVAGVALLLRRPVPPLARVVVVAVWAGMSLTLLVVGVHWASDVLGGTLLAVAITSASLLALDPNPHGSDVVEPWRGEGQPVQNRRP